MKRNLEIEYKTLIERATFDAFRNALFFSAPVKQVNEYYDTENLRLFNQHIMCRIRVIDAYYEFTLKIPQADGVMEFEVILDENKLDLNDKVIDLLKSHSVNVSEMKNVATSTTFRSTFDDEYGTWCLDETHFDNSVDYEIEYELFGPHEKAYQHYVDTLDKYNIPFRKANPKFIRALLDNQRIDH